LTISRLFINVRAILPITIMKKFPLLLLALLTLAGCLVRSVHPLYTARDLVFDPALVGVWNLVKDKETAKEIWEFQADENKTGYLLLHTDDEGRRAKLKAHLVKLGEQHFLDLEPEDAEKELNSLFVVHLTGCHTFTKVTLTKGAVQLDFFNPDWVREFLEKQPSALRHELIRDDEGKVRDLLLTAPTADLQAFVRKHAAEKEVFKDFGKLVARDAPAKKSGDGK